MNYQQLQNALKPFKDQGLTKIKLNSKKDLLQSEYERLTTKNKSSKKPGFKISGQKYLDKRSVLSFGGEHYDKGSLVDALAVASKQSLTNRKKVYVTSNCTGYHIIPNPSYIDLANGYFLVDRLTVAKYEPVYN